MFTWSGVVCVRCSLVRPCGLVCVRCSLVHLVLWCVRGVHLLTLWYGVCEVFTCSPCGVVCVRCTLVHLVLWCV